MTSDELRSTYLSFFEEKGHTIIPSSSLIPYGDPTLLLTSAGMVQFKPYFTGEAEPPNRRLASCQKCFRTTDVESVGDANHLTFFEMLGNFSIGDYFKKEAIAWAWEFVTQRLHLPPERLWITVYIDDDEAFNIWRKLGVPEKKILRFGEKDNFWGPAGDFGPCGPCSEIHYDFGEEVGCRRLTCDPACKCGRFSEIWNLVFTQYNQDKEGNRTLLPKPNIDTGMGLERIASVVQGKTNVYDTDLFTPLLERLSRLTGKKYGENETVDYNMRVVAEHSRGITFLISDGVMPSNDGRGYVLRRLLRRAALFGKRLSVDKPFLKETAVTTIEQMGNVYPELKQRRELILRVVDVEESRFSETLNIGLELLDKIMMESATQVNSKISGEDVFKLYDTYGFPVELTREIAGGHGLTLDTEGFEREMGKQRERAKASHKFERAEVASGAEPLQIKETPFVGYHHLKHQTKVIDVRFDSKSADIIQEGQEASVILESTPFYGEMGGQLGDTGEIRSSSGRFRVTDTVRIQPGVIAHRGHVTEGSLVKDDAVEAVVDEERRLDIARNHTATHLLQAALREVLGKHVQQRGSVVAPDRLRFDFSHITALTKDELKRVQRIVNDKIRRNLHVSDEDMPYRQAVERGAIALFDEKYGDVVRVLKVGEPPASVELCGGTHVQATGELGYFYIVSESSIGTGLRRIEAVTGKGAETFIDQHLSRLDEVARAVGAIPDNIEEKIKELINTLDMERKRIESLEREMAKQEAESLINRVESINGVNVVVGKVRPVSIPILREMVDLIRERLKSAIVVLGTILDDRPAFLAAVTSDLVDKGYNAGNIVKKVAGVTGGGGGGKANLAQAGGKYKDKLDEALQLVKTLL